MQVFKNSYLVFIVGICFYSCSIPKKTVRLDNGKKAFSIPFSVKNDTIILNKKKRTQTVISFQEDSIGRKSYVIEEYLNGKLSGKKYEYDWKGRLAYYGEYKKGMKHGWQFTFKNDKLLYISRYKNGVQIYSEARFQMPH